MFIVTKKPKTPNIIWDNAAKKPLCKFVKGKYETNDKAIADKLKGMGYIVEGEVDETLDEMKVDELKAYAAEHNIDLGEAKNKADILKAIEEAETN